jgi:AcrR family transcriptional regulator
MELFWEKGFEGTTVADLTAAMDIGPTSMYAAYGSKEDLFREALEHYVHTVGAQIWAEVTAASTARDAVEAFLMSTARAYSRSDRPSGCLMALAALHTNSATERLRGELAQKREGRTRELAELLMRGTTSGEIPSKADALAIARFYVTVQQGMSIQARDGADRRMLESIAQSAVSVWDVLVASTSMDGSSMSPG